MKRLRMTARFLPWAAVAVSCLFPRPNDAEAQALDPASIDCRPQSTSMLAAISKGDYEAAEQDFNAAMKQALPPAKLRAVFEQQLTAQFGPLKTIGEGQLTDVASTSVVETPLMFERGSLLARVTCASSEMIGGLHFAPRSAPPQANGYSPPPYADPSRYRELPVKVGHAPWALDGTLTLPIGKGPFPAVVLVHGSGAHDRDETHGPNKTFADLADGLATRGIAVLRYDKRSFAYPHAFDGTKTFTIDDEVTDDAVTAAERLRGTPDSIDPRRIVVLGHSLGAQLAPRIGLRAPWLAGLVLLAAPAAPLGEGRLRQLRYLAGVDGHVDAREQAALDAAESEVMQLHHLLAGEPVTGPLPFKLPATYLRSWAAVDAVADARETKLPMLVLQGERDYQVSPAEDFGRWQKAFAGSTRVRLVTYPGLSHLFMPASDPPTPADYDRPAHVDVKVVADIADWIDAKPR